MVRVSLVALLLLSGCVWGVRTAPEGEPEDTVPGVDSATTGTPPTDTDDSTTTPVVVPSPVRRVTRLSLDLRGVRPSDVEYARAIADPSEVDTLLDEFLHDPRWEDRLVGLYGERFRSLTESFEITAADVGVEDDPGFTRALGEAPIRVLSHVAASDLPYTELVTADWMMSNELLAAVWPTDYPSAGTGWQVAHYTDGRPAVGVLASTGMWWRFGSTESNANRKRANTLTRLLTCNDYLERPIEFDRSFDLSDADAVTEALTTNKACVGCHSTLDPVASYLYGFWYGQASNPEDASYYHPDREALWLSTTDVPPGWYGQPGYSLEDLGAQIAGDPRFVECAVETAWELMLRRDREVADQDALTAHREAFISGGLTLRALYGSLLRDPAYLAEDPASPGGVATKWMPPDLLASQVEDLTGFRWTSDGYDMLLTDRVGLRNLAGGADGFTVLDPSWSPNATAVLVQQRLAELAGTYAVQTERRMDPTTRRLFTEVDFSETVESDPDLLRLQAQKLYLRVLGREVALDGEEVEVALALWSDIHALTGTGTEAWSAVLIFLLRDPDFVLY